jgi:hypothetical protein
VDRAIQRIVNGSRLMFINLMISFSNNYSAGWQSSDAILPT